MKTLLSMAVIKAIYVMIIMMTASIADAEKNKHCKFYLFII